MNVALQVVVQIALLPLLSLPLLAQEPSFEEILAFDTAIDTAGVYGWRGGPPETIHLDREIVHGGNGAARMVRSPDSRGDFTTITKRIPLDFEGDHLVLRGMLRTQDVTGYVSLWMRQDGPEGVLEFVDFSNLRIDGSRDWTPYGVRLPVNPSATELFFGALVAGEGTLWVDDLELTVDAGAIADAPKRRLVSRVLELDREFEGGSRIGTTQLTRGQVNDLALLGKVWGFLKYHHPRITGGELHWDYELFRILPAVLNSPDASSTQTILSRWVRDLGVPDGCSPCAEPPENVHLPPRLGWLTDTAAVGAELSAQLQQIHRNRPAEDEQFYVSQRSGIGNTIFDRELTYREQQPVDAGYRLLALLRLWNIIEYWFPYRDQIEQDWDEVLISFLPRFAAEEPAQYQRELLSLIAQIGDGHAILRGRLDSQPPIGECYWPVAFRFVGDRPVVAKLYEMEGDGEHVLRLGDVLLEVEDEPVDALIASWLPFYSGSNRTSRLHRIAANLPRGECGESKITIERDGMEITVAPSRLPASQRAALAHDREGPAFQLLNPEVAYLKLSSIRTADIVDYVEAAAGTRGMIIDIRGYPSQFSVFELGQRLVRETTPFVRFVVPDLTNPGAFRWTPVPLSLNPVDPGYRGRVAILVDETSISQSEYTAMAFRTAPEAVVIGSTTAGADGDVSTIPLPGGWQTSMSGAGVFYPDRSPTQRVGIVPDIEVWPTVEGIRQQRDEVLEMAVRYVLGPDADEQMIRRIAAPRRAQP